MTDENTTAILHYGLESLVEDAKATDDFSAQTEELLSKTVAQLVASGRIDEAVEAILVLEKKCRQNYDAISAAKLCCKIVQIYKDRGEWKKVHEYLVSLSKKRGQLRRAITDLVHLAMGWLDSLEKGPKFELMDVLDQITNGKIFVEVERARLIEIQATIKEAEGDITEAAALLQEVQVETFGSMDKKDKVKYILNQMRLLLLKGDYIRVQICSRKINEKFLEEDDFQELKIKFHETMVQYYLHEEEYFKCCESFKKMLKTKCVEDDQARWKPVVEKFIAYLCMAKRTEEQQELMKDSLTSIPRKQLEAVSNFKTLLVSFQTNKLIKWPLAFDSELQSHEVFSDMTSGPARYDILRRRVIQHNIRIVAMYYTKVNLSKLVSILGLDQKSVEAEISELVIDKSIYARIDRAAGIVRFGREPKPEIELNKWSAQIDRVLELVKDTGHLIQKERMVQEARVKIAKKAAA